MPDLLSKKQLYDLIVRSIRDSGWNVLILPDSADSSLRLRIYKDPQSYTIRVYIWNITHGGGRRRPSNEYRIQITGISQFQSEPGGKTLILGWWNEGEVFAGFDFRKHAGILGASPSFQITSDTLQQAAANGFAPHNKGNDEIAIAFRPDFIVEYIQQLEQLHDFGESEEVYNVLDQVAQDPAAVNEEELSLLNEPRRIALRSVRAKVRDARFQQRVLRAYNYHCALCRMQLDLVEGAHIVPVAHERSTDDVFNGIALCVLHHRAYDKALVTIDVHENHYRILLNGEETKRLTEIGHYEGLEQFVQAIQSSPYLPDDVSQRPNTELIDFANVLRGWNQLGAADVQVL